MKKLIALPALSLAALLLASPPSDAAMPGFGTAGKLLGGGIAPATLPEQLVQIKIMTDQLSSLRQVIEAVGIGKEILASIDQMTELHQTLTEVISMQPPVKMGGYGTLTPDQAIARHQRLLKERQVMLGRIDDLTSRVMLDQNQMQVLSYAMNLAVEPRSDIIASQAQFLGQAAQLEQDRRAMTLQALAEKRRQIEEAIDIDDDLANQALRDCIQTGNCGG